MICSDWSYTVRYGGNLALLFRRPGKIWCAEISLERRLGGEIWGKVEWCDPVLTGNFKVCKSLAVMVCMNSPSYLYITCVLFSKIKLIIMSSFT